MVEQPAFGRRLRQLRIERGLTQGALAGDGMSTGYLSRLESGARQPTERALAHLASQLGVSTEELVASTASSLARSLTIATGLGADETGELLSGALATAGGEDSLLRWQALWQVAEWRRQRKEYAEQRVYLDELTALSDQLGLPELQARALAELARWLRSTGEVPAAVDTALTAHQLAKDNALAPYVMANVLLAVVSALAEADRLPEVNRHTDELLSLVEGRSDTLWAEALWTAANIRLRQGEPAAAAELLGEAVRGFDGRDNPTLWTRLRISAARLSLQTTPPDTEAAHRRVEEVQACLPLTGTPAIEQELLFLRAHLAMHTGHPAEARVLLDQLDRLDPLLPYQDRIELDVLRNRLLLLDGARDEAVAGLRGLAEQAQDNGNMALAADIWRLLAESLAQDTPRPARA
ncbi:helix-turn-helix transcriptional regulator [Micromonospora sp. NPDC005173]|uniref:helix-turn-helix domain-containing protein n=1 Tax=Micromonospora sp. NPDC005173 TaxID=3157165 RepID=UPI0033B99034